MNILGISAFLDDPSAALLVDGKIKAIGEEERFVRVKRGVQGLTKKTTTNNREMSEIKDFQLRHFPVQSISFCLESSGFSLGDIDIICLGFDLPKILNHRNEYQKQFSSLPEYVIESRFIAFQSYVRFLRKMADRAGAQLRFVEHHKAHSYGALFSCSYPKASILTMDGMGDFTSTKLSIWNGKDLESLKDISLPTSIGRVYSSLTNYLGFHANSDEQKVMALGAFGQNTFQKHFEKFIKPTPDSFWVDPDFVWTRECGMGYLRQSPLPSLFNLEPRTNQDPTKPPWANIACSLQEILFTVSSHLVNLLSDVGGSPNLCLSGGVALNCENNGRLLLENENVNKIHIQPQANDAGTALGAAYAVFFEETGKRAEPLKHIYFGPSYMGKEIESLLSSTKHQFHHSSDLCSEIADHLTDNKIVGWFQGASEIGPRALGNRSILCNPSNPEMKKKMNKLKGREKWRPFAATILAEDSKKYLSSKHVFPFMTVSLPTTEKGRNDLSAACHINGTTRPQTLHKETNPKFYDLISEFSNKTGISGILNTSLNLRGEPIVQTPKQAILGFWSSSMDVLVLEDFVITKN